MKWSLLALAVAVVYWIALGRHVRAAAEPSPCACADGYSCLCERCLCETSYAAAYRRSLSEGKPLVVFVRCNPRPMPGCVVTRRDDLEPLPALCVGLPDWKREDVLNVKTLAATATVEEVRAAARRYAYLAGPPPQLNIMAVPATGIAGARFAGGS